MYQGFGAILLGAWNPCLLPLMGLLVGGCVGRVWLNHSSLGLASLAHNKSLPGVEGTSDLVNE